MKVKDFVDPTCEACQKRTSASSFIPCSDNGKIQCDCVCHSENTPVSLREALAAMRAAPTNLTAEPAYPGLDTVLMSINTPGMTAHHPTMECRVEHPHLTADCQLWSKE